MSITSASTPNVMILILILMLMLSWT